jgi:hypothetical protein
VSGLTDARKKLSDFNIEFNARMEAQRLLETAALQAEIDRQVWLLADQGWSIARIMKEYGTKDFRTVKNILDKRVNKPVGPIRATVDENGTYDVYAYDEHVAFDHNDDVLVLFTWEPDFKTNGRLARELRNNPPFLEKIKGIAHGG